MNSTTQTEQNKTNNHKIKFIHAEGGEIDICTGHTVFSNLFMIGAFSLTRTLKHNDKDVWYEYPTDTEGLEFLESRSGEAVNLITDAVTTLGMMLAYVNTKELSDNTLNNYAWLVAGLGELLGQLSHANSEMSYALRHSSKQTPQNG